MIVRSWHGHVRRTDADAYAHLWRNESFRGICLRHEVREVQEGDQG